MLYLLNQKSNEVAYLKTSANEFLIFESYRQFFSQTRVLRPGNWIGIRKKNVIRESETE